MVSSDLIYRHSVVRPEVEAVRRHAVALPSAR
jgi:hypothetical protein